MKKLIVIGIALCCAILTGCERFNREWYGSETDLGHAVARAVATAIVDGNVDDWETRLQSEFSKMWDRREKYDISDSIAKEISEDLNSMMLNDIERFTKMCNQIQKKNGSFPVIIMPDSDRDRAVRYVPDSETMKVMLKIRLCDRLELALFCGPVGGSWRIGDLYIIGMQGPEEYTGSKNSESTTSITGKHPDSEAEKRADRVIEEMINDQLVSRLRSKGATKSECDDLKRQLIEKFRSYPVDTRVDTARMTIHEVIRMHNL